MTKLNRAGDTNSLGDINITQGDIRTQFDAATDMLRQLGGNPEKGDPLTAPFQLYVNPVTGSDKFVGGSYVTTDDGTFESKMRRIELQRLECGYTISRPFRSLARACLEAAIITSKAYFDISPAPCGDLVSINLSTGVHVIGNGTGELVDNITAWTDGKEPTAAELQEFNTQATGGLILPRGCSVYSLDLRKTIIRPDSVPSPAGETATNRQAIFKTTGGNFLFGLTFLDKEGYNESHHLLHCFEYSSKAELDELYEKIREKFPSAAGIDNSLAVTRTSEWQVVGPQPASPSSVVDTVAGASPYVYNCSIRSDYGLCGIYASGSKNAGSFRSFLVAQFTGVSLQKDMRCWEAYNKSSKAWAPLSSTTPDKQAGDYTNYINTDPNDLRGRDGYKHFHCRALNRAVIQEVSVFAIGQHIMHKAESGAELTITNSSSNFGLVSGLAEGYSPDAQRFDQGWEAVSIRRPLNPLTKTQAVQRINIGVLKPQSNSYNWETNTTLVLDAPLQPSNLDPNQPLLLTADGYSLKAGDRVWIDNPGGPDYVATLASRSGKTWDGNVTIQIQGGIDPAPETNRDNDPNNTLLPPAGPDDGGYGFQVYIRRLKDIRTVDERRYSAQLRDPRKAGEPFKRLPIRDYVVQKGGGDWSEQYAAVTRSEVDNSDDKLARIELRASKIPVAKRDYDAAVFYRKGDVVIQDGKHFVALRDTTGTFDDKFWAETFVHMPSTWAPEGNDINATPILVFDKDDSDNFDSQTLGNTLADVEDQIKSATDYQGLYWQLINWGMNASDEATYLNPQSTEAARDKSLPSGWADIEMRRPSNTRMFGMAFEWPGGSNYSRALPAYQKTLNPQNQFSYYFTNSEGGKCYLSGFNQEGFQVTTKGVEDLATGEVLSVADVGNPDRPINIPTKFGDITVDSIKPNSPEGYLNLPQSTTTKDGVERKASVKQITDQQFADTKDDRAIDQSPMMTLAGLNLWRESKGVVTESTEPTILFVCPDDAVAGKEYNWNGFKATLKANPDRGFDNVIKDPPGGAPFAVKLNVAIRYANTFASARQTVIYRLANGPYFNRLSQTFNHIAVVTGATKQFRPVLANGRPDFSRMETVNYEAGGKPNIDARGLITQVNGWTAPGAKLNASLIAGSPTNVAERLDKTNLWPAPVFASGLDLRFENLAANSRSNVLIVWSRCITFSFSQGGTLEGCIFLGPEDTWMTQVFNNQSKLWGQSGGTWTPKADVIDESSPGDTLKLMYDNMYAWAASRQAMLPDNPYGWAFDLWTSRVNFYTAQRFNLLSCILCAKAPNFGRVGYGGKGPWIRPTDDCDINCNGLYILGNIELNDSKFPKENVRTNGIYVYGKASAAALIDGYEPRYGSLDIGPLRINLTFNIQSDNRSSWTTTDNSITNSVFTRQRNYEPNCIHFLNIEGKYPEAADNNSGPFFEAFIGRFNAGSQITFGGYSNFERYRNATGKFAGLAGKFGSITGTDYPTQDGVMADRKARLFATTRTGQNEVPPITKEIPPNRMGPVFWQLANSGGLVRKKDNSSKGDPGTDSDLPSDTQNIQGKKPLEILNVDAAQYEQGMDTTTLETNLDRFRRPFYL